MSSSVPSTQQQHQASTLSPDGFDRRSSLSPQPVPSPPSAPTPIRLKALEARSHPPLKPDSDLLSLLKKNDDRRLFAPSPAPTYRTSAASPPPANLRRSSSLRPPLPPIPSLHQDSVFGSPKMRSLHAEPLPQHDPSLRGRPLSEQEDALESPAEGSVLRRVDGASPAERSIEHSAEQNLMNAIGDMSGTEGMDEAEIAQHHFRLAQQHLETAQRLARAAASRSSRPSPSEPSLAPAFLSSHPRILASSPPRDDDLESSIDPDESISMRSPRSFGSVSTAIPAPYDEYEAAATDLSQLSLGKAETESVYEFRRSRSLSSLAASPPQHAPLSSPSSAYPASTRSAPTLPQAGPTPAQAYALQQQELGMEDDDLVASSDGGHDGLGGGGSNNEQARNSFFDDGASDFGGDESTFSHVTNATLPPYDFGYAAGGRGAALPAVPPIPARYAAAAAASAPPLAVAAVFSADENVHGIRPRLAPATPSPASSLTTSSGPRTIVDAPSPYAAQPHSHGPASPISLPSPQSFAAPQFSAAHLVPHSYILSPTGQPIPVYASPSSLPVPSSAIPLRGTLPIHAQPLQFDAHTLPYSHAVSNARPPPTPVPAPAYAQHPLSVYSSHSTRPQTLHPSHSTASFTPSYSSSSSSTHPSHSTISFAAQPPTSRAPSVSGFSDSSSSSNHTTATGSTGMKGRMASLRAKMKSSYGPSSGGGGGMGPRVRFQSPGPEGAKQRALMGGVGEVMDEQDKEKKREKSTAAGGAGKDADKQRKGLQMSMSMLL
ncbi:hypothetical protein JCM11251_001726 [Rhodosporidiobolus azoricus]